ncbi:unnamed protein product [Cuscuta campestris]|uniref:Uncharacterized protein n=1 Tax=Cuscuta campestris TaxID=132261 RepID=A0A484LGN3_9ASTE|nr:unnamed protein product [Cuscuta campestris]
MNKILCVSGIAFWKFREKELLGKTACTDNINDEVIVMGQILDVRQQLMLIEPISPEELKPNHKSPGPDGFTSGF